MSHYTIQFHCWDHKKAAAQEVPIKKVLVTADTEEEAKSQGEILASALSLSVNDSMNSKGGYRFHVFAAVKQEEE